MAKKANPARVGVSTTGTVVTRGAGGVRRVGGAGGSVRQLGPSGLPLKPARRSVPGTVSQRGSASRVAQMQSALSNTKLKRVKRK